MASHTPNLIVLIYDAIMRPARFATFLDGGRNAILQAALATLIVLGITLGVIVLGLAQILSLGRSGLLGGVGFGYILTHLSIAFYWVEGTQNRSNWARAGFAIMRPLIAIAPPSAIFFAILFSETLADQRTNPVLILLMVAFFGAWLGNFISVMLILKPRRAESAGVRRVLAGGALIAGGEIAWSPTLHQTEAVLFMPFCVGMMIGLARPFSYLWEASLSLGLYLAAQLGIPATRLLQAHPVRYDDLSVLPFPGLRNLLVRACTADCALGGSWLVRVAQHPGQQHAARRAVERIVRDGVVTHQVLLWLSTRSESYAFLHTLAEQPHPHPLIAAYAAFAQVTAPEAWPTVVDEQRSAVACAVDLPGGRALLAFLEIGAATLRADRWATALTYLRATAHDGAEPDLFGTAFETIQAWAAGQPDTFRAAEERCASPEGWPAMLIAAMSEHIQFLIRIECRRTGSA